MHTLEGKQFLSSPSWDTEHWISFVSKCGKKKMIEFVTKVGWPLPTAHRGPKEPSLTSQCDPYAALWQTEHPCVFILYVEASHFVAEVIGQKQSLVLIGFLQKRGNVRFLYCTVITVSKVYFLFYVQRLAKEPTWWKLIHFLVKWIFLWYLCLSEERGLKINFWPSKYDSFLRGLLALIVWVVLLYWG